MVSSGYVPAGTGLEVRPNEIKQLMTNPHNAMGGVTFSKFDTAMGHASDWIGAVGPGIDSLLGGHVTAKAMANSTVSALMGQGGAGPSMPGTGIGGGMGSGAYGFTPNTMKNLGGAMPGPPPGYTGGGGGIPGAPPGFGGAGPGSLNPAGGSDVSQFDSQINSMMSNNLMFLALQTKVQNVSQSAQMLSNLAKTDHETKLSAVRNIRSG